jgi:hypothetical protein
MDAVARNLSPREHESEDRPPTILLRASEPAPQREPAAAAQDHTPQIFGVSAGLTGVSLSGIGLFAILSHIRSVQSLGEELLALNATVFALSCVSAYLTMKAGLPQRKRRFQLCAEGLFVFGLILMASACVFLALSLNAGRS